jgi:hypothetical protein
LNYICTGIFSQFFLRIFESSLNQIGSSDQLLLEKEKAAEIKEQTTQQGTPSCRMRCDCSPFDVFLFWKQQDSAGLCIFTDFLLL